MATCKKCGSHHYGLEWVLCHSCQKTAEKEKAEARRSAAACSIFDLECCPICGGKSGFSYRITMRGRQFQPWKGSDGDAFFEDTDTKHGAYRCDDCGKIIKSNV